MLSGFELYPRWVPLTCSRKRNCVTKFIRENYKEKMNIPAHTKESTDGHTLIGIVAFENLLGLTVIQSSFLSFETFDIMIYCLKLLFRSCCCDISPRGWFGLRTEVLGKFVWKNSSVMYNNSNYYRHNFVYYFIFLPPGLSIVCYTRTSDFLCPLKFN